MRKASKKTLKLKCDKLWSLIIRYPGICEVCGKPANNPHHIVGRINHVVRWDLNNGCLLCSGCHMLNKTSAHADPIGFLKWLYEQRPYDYIYLSDKKNETVKLTIEFYQDTLRRLIEESKFK